MGGVACALVSALAVTAAGEEGDTPGKIGRAAAAEEAGGPGTTASFWSEKALGVDAVKGDARAGCCFCQNTDNASMKTSGQDSHFQLLQSLAA